MSRLFRDRFDQDSLLLESSGHGRDSVCTGQWTLSEYRDVEVDERTYSENANLSR